MRVVMDTNVLISGLFFGGAPGKIIDIISSKTIIPCFTVATFYEFQRVVMSDKFSAQRGVLDFSVSDFVAEMKFLSDIFEDLKILPDVIKDDPADNHILACALAANAEYIVSGDTHLLKLKTFQNIPILSPRQFLNKIK